MTDTTTQTTQQKASAILPMPERRAMVDEPGIGAGTFLRHALAHNPNPDVPFVYRQDVDEHGQVRLHGHSLNDLGAIRDRYASWYWANGVRPGDPVGVYVAEGLEPLLQFLGLTALGAIPAMINNNMPAETMSRYVAHIGVVGLVTDDPAALRRAVGQDRLRGLRFVASTARLRDHDPAPGELPSRYPYQHADDDVVALIHSSGTTGMPKATIVGHQQFWVGRRPRVLAFPSERDDRVLSALPHTHAAGISYLMNSVLTGVPIVAMSDWRRQAVQPTMEVYQPTVVVSFPRTYVELATGELPVTGAARVHTWISTGDRAHDAHVRRLVQLGRRPATPDGQPARDGSRFVDGLGSSELGMSLFQQVTTPESARDDLCCIGTPIDVVQQAVVLDENGRELPDDTPGLLGVRTPTRTPGYWRAPELNDRHELGGYWLSGDVVRRDGNGRFYYLDRNPDVIQTADGPVHSLPIEEALLADRAELVLDCAVVGVPGPAGDGQEPVAVIVLQPGVEEPADLLDTLNGALAAAHLPSLAAVLVADDEWQLPTGTTGKVLKRELRERLAGVLTGAGTAEALAASAVGTVIR